MKNYPLVAICGCLPRCFGDKLQYKTFQILPAGFFSNLLHQMCGSVVDNLSQNAISGSQFLQSETLSEKCVGSPSLLIESQETRHAPVLCLMPSIALYL